jgi:hypothetical protein
MNVKTFLLLAVLPCFLLTACTDDNEYTYYYEVTGTAGRFGVTFQDESNEVVLGGVVGNGWTYTWNQTGKRFVFVTAQSEEREGSVTVKLYKNGKVIAKDTQSGVFATASVTGNY